MLSLSKQWAGFFNGLVTLSMTGITYRRGGKKLAVAVIHRDIEGLGAKSQSDELGASLCRCRARRWRPTHSRRR
jgi:hypothetical protein